MKLLVISDTHGNISAIKHVLGFAKKQNMNAIVHCGDWSTAQDVAEVLRAGIPLYAVLGNADEARYSEIWDALKPAVMRGDLIEFELDSRKIAVAHQPYKVSERIQSGKYNVVFYGHLHMAAKVEKVGNTLIVNPGALGNTAKSSFAVYDTTTNTAELIEISI